MKDKSLSTGNARLNIYAMKDKKQPTRNAEYLREYRKRMTAEQKEKRREYNKEYLREYRKRLTDEQKEKQRAYMREYLKATAYNKAWYQKNKDKMAEWRKEYYRTNSEARSNHKIRCWLWQALKREGANKSSWIDNVGCTKDEFKAHIESQFVEGMTWDNWTVDGWHIDHIIPLAKGGTNHYTNLQPLWAIDNLSKGSSC